LPEQTSRYRAPRPPCLGHEPERLPVRPLRQGLQPLDRHLQRQIARRPDIVPPQGEQQEDLSAPVSEAAEFHDRGQGLLVSEPSEPLGREAPIKNRAREAAGIADLLPREAAVLKCVLIELEEAPRRQRPTVLLEAFPEFGRDIERELLLQDNVQERAEARGPAREARQAIGLEDAREIGIEPGENPGAVLQSVGGRPARTH
jgi:hypothetical protein